ncbi:transformation system protein [Campylobacter hepaticus]|uniref:Transformation system protein n=1 Tax=Campylobacter hepaticus TaxID=1813019 RepID=A0A424Z0H1_9BACT|nr:transformation system protein [Campylobacter hepaticus]AXP08834.1 transformation system protein [Campylobacter hepaticus]MCZ0771879.1 transformation system protein [Campylobacter hepaticus]MCZ0773254.1 transformation system protein [Campylobacter hepaticus]MCZ0774505.1 transformation system protein [Campylobacter hepaticus]MCZ0775930.1 transformation system protein [Campylobacter hepaticus]
MQERIDELEARYKYFLLKKYLKYLFFVILFFIIGLSFFVFLQKYKQQKNIYLKALEYKINLEQKLAKAQILQEKNKIAKERLKPQILKTEEENTKKIEINSRNLNISHLRKSFYENPSYEKALNLANKYFDIKAYKKSIFWALKANELNKEKQDSWLVFAKAKRALGEEKEAQSVLDAYVNYYGFMEFNAR